MLYVIEYTSQLLSNQESEEKVGRKLKQNTRKRVRARKRDLNERYLAGLRPAKLGPMIDSVSKADKARKSIFGGPVGRR